MSLLDGLIVVAFILYAVRNGFRERAVASRSLEEYFLAGRSLPGWKAGLSMAATQFAADTPLLVTGLIATAGIFALWQLWVYAIAFLLMGFVLARSWRRSGVLTDAELTEVRYGRRPAAILRGFKAIYFGTVFNCVVLGWVFFAAAKVAEPFLLWDQWLPAWLFEPLVEFVRWALHRPLAISTDATDPETWVRSASNLVSVLAIVLVTTLYSTTGGLRSVANTDVVQITLMLGATFLFAWIVVAEVGGLAALGEGVRTRFADGGPGGITPDQILAFDPSNAMAAGGWVLLLFALQWLIQLNADGTGYLAQRCMACRSDFDSRLAAVVFVVTQIFLRSLLWLPIGVGLLLLFPPDMSLEFELLKAEREATFVRGMAELLPAGVLGLMVTGMLAALASTVDTHLNWGSSYWTNDIYKRFVCEAWLKKTPSQRSLVWVARLSNLFILLIALYVMTQLDNIDRAWRTSLLLGAGMGVPLVLRWLWWRVNAWAEIAAIAASLVMAVAIIFFDLPRFPPGASGYALQLLSMALVSTLAALGAIFLAGPEDPGRLAEFYRRARPPGFWGPIARAAGVADEGAPLARLARQMLGVVLCALSVFCLLTAAGSLLVGSPPPTWLPDRTAWITLLAVVGMGLVPVWWRLAMRGPGVSAEG
jgi:solute:Na+ symporter, SSS family